MELNSRMARLTDQRGHEDCWPWLGNIALTGYGRISIGNRLQYAHRIAYTLAKGPILGGLTIDHLCRNRACVNPAHLEMVTLSENIRRAGLHGIAAIHAVKDTCPQGHPYDGLYVHSGRRQRTCRTCAREANRRYEQRPANRQLNRSHPGGGCRPLTRGRSRWRRTPATGLE